MISSFTEGQQSVSGLTKLCRISFSHAIIYGGIELIEQSKL